MLNLKQLIVSCIVLIFLTGCGTEKGTSDIDDNILYSHDGILTHEMEDVIVEMTYIVDDSNSITEYAKQNSIQEDAIFVQGTVNLTNETANPIYYAPSFYAIDKNGKRYENTLEYLGMNDGEQIILQPNENTEFRIAFILSETDYYSLSELEVTVPVPFLEPDSESSGDALGDTKTWIIKIKE